MSDRIQKVIREYYPSLSRGQKKVAEFIINNLEETAMLTAYQLGEKVGLSETTVIRLAYVLGYQGYTDMQGKIRASWLGDRVPKEKEANKNVNDFNKEIFEAVAEREKNMYQQLVDQLDIEELWKVVELLVHAKHVYIGGFGSSYAAGYSFYYALKQIRGNVYLSSPAGVVVEDLAELDSDTVVVIFSFPRYRKEGDDLVCLARKIGATVLTLTNKQLSPVAQKSDLVITTQENMESDYHSIAPAISVAEMLGQAIMQKIQKKSSERQQRLEMLYNFQELFLE